MHAYRTDRLAPEDAAGYFALRREMLAQSPYAFGSSLKDDRFQSVESVKSMLAEDGKAVVGVWIDQGLGLSNGSTLVGVAGMVRETKLKRLHVVGINSVYVTPTARGQGVGRMLLEATIAVVRSWPGVEQLELCVSELAPEARALYLSLGFRAWGIQPCALKVEERMVDETHMTLRFSDP